MRRGRESEEDGSSERQTALINYSFKSKFLNGSISNAGRFESISIPKTKRRKRLSVWSGFGWVGEGRKMGGGRGWKERRSLSTKYDLINYSRLNGGAIPQGEHLAPRAFPREENAKEKLIPDADSIPKIPSENILYLLSVYTNDNYYSGIYRRKLCFPNH